MPKNKICEDSPIPKFIYLKIQRQDGVESLTTLEEGEFKVPIDGCIKLDSTLKMDVTSLCSARTEQIYYRGDTLEHDMDKPERGFQLPKRAL